LLQEIANLLSQQFFVVWMAAASRSDSLGGIASWAAKCFRQFKSTYRAGFVFHVVLLRIEIQTPLHIASNFL
jgi:hypothetical protein